MTRHAHKTATRAACTTCGSPAFSPCVNDNGDPVSRSHPARNEAARSVPIVPEEQLDGLDRVAADPSAGLHPTVRGELLDKGWIRALDPVRGGRQRFMRYPRRRHEVTEAGQEIRRRTGRGGVVKASAKAGS